MTTMVISMFDDFTINKTNTDMSVDEVINNAEALINGTEINIQKPA